MKIRRDLHRKKYCGYSCRQKHKIATDPRYMANFLAGQLLSNTPEANAKKINKGEANGRYLKDRAKLKKPRCTDECKEWRKAIFARDNYTCQLCGKCGGTLQADHILPYCTHPELRLDLNNGRTLCVECHKKTPTYGSKVWKLLKEKQNAVL